jgi:hypothetical protein
MSSAGSRKDRTFSRCGAETSGPMAVVASSGSPTANVEVAATNRATNSS